MNTIDLKKEKHIQEKQIVIDQLVFNTEPLPEFKTEIQIKISLESKKMDDVVFMEDLKLELINEINDAIRNIDTENKVKLKTQIIIR